MSLAVPHRAEPYSMPCRYFLAFLLRKYTASRSPAPQEMPISKSSGCRLGSGFANAAGSVPIMDIMRSPSSFPSQAATLHQSSLPPAQAGYRQIQSQQFCQLLCVHSPRSCSLCRTLPGSSAAACTSSCSLARTEGRFDLLRREAEYSLKAD